MNEPTNLQHNAPKKDWKCRLKVKRSQKKSLPRPDLLALPHTHARTHTPHSLRLAVDLLNNLTSFCAPATSIKGFWSSTFSLHNDTSSFFLFSFLRSCLPLFLSSSQFSQSCDHLKRLCWEREQSHLKHSCSTYLDRQGWYEFTFDLRESIEQHQGRALHINTPTPVVKRPKHRLPTLTRILVTQMMQMSGGTGPDHRRREEFAPTRAAHDLTLFDKATGRTTNINRELFTSEQSPLQHDNPAGNVQVEKAPDEED